MGFFLIGMTLFTYHLHYLGTGFLQITCMEMTKNLKSADMVFSTQYQGTNFLMKIHFEKCICRTNHIIPISHYSIEDVYMNFPTYEYVLVTL